MDEAKRAIEAVMSDKSVSPEETARRLKDLREDINVNLVALSEDGVDVDAA